MMADDHIVTFKTWDKMSIGLDLRVNYLTHGVNNIIGTSGAYNTFYSLIGDLDVSGLRQNFRNLINNSLNLFFLGVDLRPMDKVLLSFNSISLVAVVVDYAIYRKFDAYIHLNQIFAAFTFEYEINTYFSLRMNIGQAFNRFVQAFVKDASGTRSFVFGARNFGGFVVSGLDLIYPDFNKLISFNPIFINMLNSLLAFVILNAVTYINFQFIITKP